MYRKTRDVHNQQPYLAVEPAPSRASAHKLLAPSCGEQDAADAREDLVDRLLEEFVCAANMFGDTSRGALAQGFGTAATEDAETHEYAEALAYGWPAVHDELWITK